MKNISDILDIPSVYKLWQSPFYKQKVAPLINELRSCKPGLKVLDLGCGPGTNLEFFKGHYYTGVDLNPAYIKNIKPEESVRAICDDVNNFLTANKEKYDLVLINSLMHHLTEDEVENLLTNLDRAITEFSKVYIFDLILPLKFSIPRALAKLDRGHFARPFDKWKEIFCRHFALSECFDYYLRYAGIDLWHMIYFKGLKLAKT